MNELQYFEVVLSNGSSDDSNAEWICIRGTEQPTLPEAQEFLARDSKRIGAPVVGVYPIDEHTARGCYDFDNEAIWPIFTRENERSGESIEG